MEHEIGVILLMLDALRSALDGEALTSQEAASTVSGIAQRLERVTGVTLCPVPAESDVDEFLSGLGLIIETD